jgi:hypothetical protein
MEGWLGGGIIGRIDTFGCFQTISAFFWTTSENFPPTRFLNVLWVMFRLFPALIITEQIIS